MSHPVYCCGLLVLKAFVSGAICYSVFGFSWYTLLFCLVYVGGVYILFVFVSVYRPKSKFVSYFSISYYSTCVWLFFIIIFGGFIVYSLISIEFSEYLCTVMEGKFYICMCLTLVFGFIVLSMVMSVKFKFYR